MAELSSAFDYVYERWVPVNRAHLLDIKEKIQTGAICKTKDVIEEISKDVMLYVTCIKKLVEKRREQGIVDEIEPTLCFFEEDDIKKVIMEIDPDKENSYASLEKLTPCQRERLKESVISALSVEEMSREESIGAELGFSCALLRQMGLTLIAWNYPYIFEKAVDSLGKETPSLDDELRRVLGFSPTMLAVKLAKEWGLIGTARYVVGDSSSEHKLAEGSMVEQRERAIASKISKLCEIGEALARATSSIRYPTARHDWSFAKREITLILGESGLKLIQQRINKTLSDYAAHDPSFEVELSEKVEKVVDREEYRTALIKQNVYLSYCPPLLKIAIAHIYERITADEVCKDLIRELITEIIPKAGFIGGCIYMLEQSTMRLTPMITIPSEVKGGYEYKTLSLNRMNLESNPVITAFRCLSPIRQSQEVDGDDKIETISGSLGIETKAGVLHLILGEKLIGEKAFDPLIIFKAIRLCLCHLLRLN